MSTVSTRAPARADRPAQSRPPAKRRRPRRREQQWPAYVFLTPWMLGAAVLTLVPMAVSLYLSFTDYNLFDPPQWVGLRNYQEMLTEDPGSGGRSAPRCCTSWSPSRSSCSSHSGRRCS